MEDIFQYLSKNKVPVDTQIIDLLSQCKNSIVQISNSLKKGDLAVSVNTLPLVNKIKFFYNKYKNTSPELASNTSIFPNISIELIKEWPEQIIYIKAIINKEEPAPDVRSYLLEHKIVSSCSLLYKFPIEDENIIKFKQVEFWISSSLSIEEIRKTINVDSLDSLEIIFLNKADLFKKTVEVSEAKEFPTENVTESLNQSFVKISLLDLDNLFNSASELVILNSDFYQIQQMLQNNESMTLILRRFRDVLKQMLRVSIQIQTMVMNSRLVPIQNVFNRFTRFVKDYSAKNNKQIEFTITGGDTGLDKKIIEEIVKPLTHIIRNSLDHGIETIEERLQNNKPPKAKLGLSASQVGNFIYIQVEDDGRGLNYSKILKKAIEKGLVTEEQSKKLTDDEIKEFIFKPGFSSKDSVDEMSGRGIGLDVVKNVIEYLNGTIEFNSKYNIGSTITLKLPLTVAILEAFLIKIGGDTFFIPIKSVIDTTINKYSEIEVVHNIECIKKNSSYIPLIRPELLIQGVKLNNHPKEDDSKDFFYSVLIQVSGIYYILKIDEFIQKQDIIIKSLADNYKNIDAILGASILGNGSIALILDIIGLIKLYHNEIEQLGYNLSNLSSIPMDIQNTKDAIGLKEDANINMMLRDINAFLEQENRYLLTEWFKQANTVALEGLSIMIGINIKIRKSIAKVLSYNKLMDGLNQSEADSNNLLYFILPILPINGYIVLITNRKSSAKIVELLLKQIDVEYNEDDNALNNEPMLELLNVVGSAYTNSLASLTKLPIEPGIPEFYQDINVIKEILSSKQDKSPNLVYVHNEFLGENNFSLGEIIISIPCEKIKDE